MIIIRDNDDKMSRTNLTVGLCADSKPYAHVLVQLERSQRCDECLHLNSELLRCSACTVTRYCNKTCQRNAWRIHKEECKAFKRVSPMIPKDSALLMFRLLVKIKLGDDKTEFDDWFGVKRTFNDLMSHCENVKKDAKRCEEFVQICHTLKAFAGEDFVFPGASDMLEIFGKMTINSFSICDAEMQPIGAGIYLGPSALNHSCQPNAVAVFNGSTLCVRSIENITHPEQVTISYIDQLETTTCRQHELESCYYFLCQCSKCLDVEIDELLQSTVCPTDDCTGLIMQTQDGKFELCSSCRRSEFTEDYRQRKQLLSIRCLQTLDTAKQLKANKSRRELLEQCEKCLEDHSDLLHPFNIYHIQLTDRLFDACIDLSLWERAATIGNQLLQPYRRYLPGFHPNVGIHLMKLGKIQLYLDQFSHAKVSLEQAEYILRVTHGVDHPLYCDLTQLLQQSMQEMILLRQLDSN